MVKKSLTANDKKKIKSICDECHMKGEGVSEVLQRVKDYLINIGKTVGPVILKDLIVPYLVKKAKEKMGMGLKLAGQGKNKKVKGKGVKKPHMVKGSQEAKDHMAKLRAMKKK